jgi:hypothetical protein
MAVAQGSGASLLPRDGRGGVGMSAAGALDGGSGAGLDGGSGASTGKNVAGVEDGAGAELFADEMTTEGLPVLLSSTRSILRSKATCDWTHTHTARQKHGKAQAKLKRL